MKKILILIAFISLLNSCDTAVKTETTTTDSLQNAADTAPLITIDTNHKIVRKAKVLIDSAKNKMEKAADKIKEGADKIIKEGDNR